jgi:hypothetical protein
MSTDDKQASGCPGAYFEESPDKPNYHADYECDRDGNISGPMRPSKKRMAESARKLLGVPELPAPYVKVTEVVGHMDGRGQHVFLCSGENTAEYAEFGIGSLMPIEACKDTLPRGRFRVTVEFWPEDKP